MSFMVLTMLMHNYNGKTVKMPPTVYTAAESISAIAGKLKTFHLLMEIKFSLFCQIKQFVFIYLFSFFGKRESFLTS